MTEYKELAARAEKYLDLGMRMGHMSDSASNIYRIAADLLICAKSQQARIEALEAERDEARREVERLTPLAVAYDYLESPARADMAEARCKRLEEALRPFAGEKLPRSKRSEISRNEWGLRCLMSPLEIARQAARLALQENTNGG